jgi:tetratricopeptide (TPR) repeat protein
MGGMRTLLACLLLVLVPPALAQAAGSAAFDAGVAAYRAGQTAEALAAFRQAQAAGLDTPQLHLNLGLSCYRLGRHDEARAAFERLREFPDYRHIADFHLGLVAARQGERGRAEALWRGVERDAPQQALRDRARVARARLGGRAGSASGYVLVAVGHDSNPALLDESLQPSGTGSASTELLGVADLPLGAAAGGTLWAQAGAYSRGYSESGAPDQSGLFAALARERHGASRRRDALEASTSRLDGEPFIDLFAAASEARPRVGEAGAAWRVQLARLEADAAHDYLDGWRLRAELEHHGRRVRYGALLELNDRADLDTGTEFFSHSPVRVRLGFDLDRPAGAWTLRWSLRDRYSAYLDPNRVLDGGGTLVEQRRSENLVQAGLRARRPLARDANLLLEYQYQHNTSSVDGFDYDRHLLLTGLEWLPRGD